MAGMPGRSGGARPGAGRKPRQPILSDSEALSSINDPAAWLTALMREPAIPIRERIDAAAALLRHRETK